MKDFLRAVRQKNGDRPKGRGNDPARLDPVTQIHFCLLYDFLVGLTGRKDFDRDQGKFRSCRFIVAEIGWFAGVNGNVGSEICAVDGQCEFAVGREFSLRNKFSAPAEPESNASTFSVWIL